MNETNIILTGFMGTGKSTVGRLLAQQLGYTFIDTDALIVQRDGRSIAAIFAESGEAVFRQWEQTIATDLAAQMNLVIATGGGLMLDQENAAKLSQNGHVFCLTASPQAIIRRLRHEGGKRPLLNVADPAREIRRLLTERAEGYGRFRQIDTTDKSARQVTREIMQCISAI